MNNQVTAIKREVEQEKLQENNLDENDSNENR